LTRLYDNAPGNTVKIIIGDANAKIGKEAYYVPTIGLDSAHDLSNDNGGRLISFAASRNMIISSTTFPHKRIHKLTWSAPDGRTKNQIDHLLIDKRFRSSITDVRSYRGADCDSDHFLVIAKFRIKLQRMRIQDTKVPKFNVEQLKCEVEKKNYTEELEK
jgi:endonuclease/exonuclease/phosphatase family metal-dependent hydrolase